MIERLKRSAEIKPARDSTARCDDIVFCGTANARAISPAASPLGSCRTRSRKASRRVGCAKAAKARTVCSDSIYLEISIYNDQVNCLESVSMRFDLKFEGRTRPDGVDICQFDHPDRCWPDRIKHCRSRSPRAPVRLLAALPCWTSKRRAWRALPAKICLDRGHRGRKPERADPCPDIRFASADGCRDRCDRDDDDWLDYPRAVERRLSRASRLKQSMPLWCLGLHPEVLTPSTPPMQMPVFQEF